MHRYDALRYALWGGILATAEANRRHYRLTTTWLPHLVTNTLALLLPDAARPLAAATDTAEHTGDLQALRATVAQLACDNPHYVLYVTPLAAGYLTSNPKFNIYKGELGELTFLGFGLDAIPHAATAFALTALVWDGARATDVRWTGDSPLARLVRWGRARPALLSGAVLVLATLLWEMGEYRIHKHELAQRGSIDAINMQWSVRDTVFDCMSNALGWSLAVVWRSKG